MGFRGFREGFVVAVEAAAVVNVGDVDHSVVVVVGDVVVVLVEGSSFAQAFTIPCTGKK